MGFSDGVSALFSGIEVAFSRPVRRYILLPAALSLVVISAGLAIALSYIGQFSSYLSALSWWPDFLSWLVDPLLYLLGILMGAWLFSFLATIIGSPFYGNLSAQVDGAGVSEGKWTSQIWPTITREWAKLRYVLPRLVGMFALGFVPGINVIAPLVWLAYGGWLMAVQFSDFWFENRAVPFPQTLSTLRRHRMACIGLGAGMTFAMSIPLLNFIVAPVAVVAATRFAGQLHARSSEP